MQTTKTYNKQQTRNAVVYPLMEKVKVIQQSEEEIFGEKYVHVINSMNRVVKVNKSALKYE